MTSPVPARDLAHEPDFALGALKVRPSTREVLGASGAEVLEPRVMQVLATLARRRGAVVSRGDLVAECWGGRAVGDDAINRCIQALRRLSGAQGGFSIHTVNRVGYRLDALEDGAPVLAVLAFDNLSGDPEMVWFSDGISVEILQTVALGAGVRVIGQGSSFQFRGADKAVARVAAELGATHVLDGSVRRAGSRLRVSAHLVAGSSGIALWSMTFERELADVFAVQDEIAGAVAAALRLAFAPTRPPERIEPAIHDLYLRARTPPAALSGALDQAEPAQSLALLERVTTEAPAFARAWAELAMTRVICLRRLDRERFPGLTAESAATAAETALRLDGSLGLPHQALSYLAPPAAYAEREALHRRALAAAPNDPRVLNLAGQFLAEVGRLSEALDLASKAAELDPLYWPAAQWKAGLLGALRRHDEARVLWDASLARWPEVEALAGEAIADAANAGDWARLDALIEASRRSGHVGERFQAFVQAQMDRRTPRPEALAAHHQRVATRFARNGTVSLMDLAQLCAAGGADEAFDYVERAPFGHMLERGGSMRGRTWTPAVIFVAANRAMIADPRFARLCRKLGLSDYWVSSGRWPDCADLPELSYDFRAACRESVEG
jgi:TolB-like protein/Tfp pilus assembly protein PilF